MVVKYRWYWFVANTHGDKKANQTLDLEHELEGLHGVASDYCFVVYLPQSRSSYICRVGSTGLYKVTSKHFYNSLLSKFYLPNSSSSQGCICEFHIVIKRQHLVKLVWWLNCCLVHSTHGMSRLLNFTPGYLSLYLTIMLYICLTNCD